MSRYKINWEIKKEGGAVQTISPSINSSLDKPFEPNIQEIKNTPKEKEVPTIQEIEDSSEKDNSEELTSKEDIQEDLTSKFNITKIMTNVLEQEYNYYFKKYNLDDIVESVENLDIDKLFESMYNLANNTFTNITDTFIESWTSNIKDIMEEKTNKITTKLLSQNKTKEEIEDILKKLPNIDDINDITKTNFFTLDFQKLAEFFIQKKLEKMGLKTEEQVTEFLKTYTNSVISTSLEDAAASAPLTITQFVASIFPFGTEPLVAVNKLNETLKELSNTAVKKLMDVSIDTLVPDDSKLQQGGRRRIKNRRKSKSKQFYINRIKRTLKYFYNY